jgi:urease subunit alpha
MFGAYGKAVGRTSVTFLSGAALDARLHDRLGLDRWVEAVRSCRVIGKAQMVHNSATPEIRVDPETYQVTVDGRPATIGPAESVCMSQLYYIV